MANVMIFFRVLSAFKLEFCIIQTKVLLEENM